MTSSAPTEPVLPGARALIERVMRDGRPVAPECPLVFESELGPERAGRLVALSEGGQVQSACAILPREFVVRGRSLRLGLIGYVVTDPGARGRGFATQTLEAADGALRERGCVASLLWADDAAFYRRLGYQPVGAELDFVLDAEALRALPRWSATRSLDPLLDAPAVHAIAERRPVRVRRTLAETRALLRLPGMRARVALRGGEIVAFACEGRGEDLAGAVHEWGGEPLAVLGLAAELAEPRVAAGQPAFLMAPGVGLDVGQALVDLGVRSGAGVLGMGRLLDRDAALEALGPVPGAGQLDDAELLGALLPAGLSGPGVSPFGGLFAWGLDSI